MHPFPFHPPDQMTSVSDPATHKFREQDFTLTQASPFM
jgi:hypothetical protein